VLRLNATSYKMAHNFKILKGTKPRREDEDERTKQQCTLQGNDMDAMLPELTQTNTDDLGYEALEVDSSRYLPPRMRGRCAIEEGHDWCGEQLLCNVTSKHTTARPMSGSTSHRTIHTHRVR